MKHLESVKQLRYLQGEDGHWNISEYDLGLFNGIELILSILEERAPEYRRITPSGTSLSLILEIHSDLLRLSKKSKKRY
jgi:hypothetical protein